MYQGNYSFTSKQITIYFGIPIFIAGVVGGIFNIMIFLSLRTFRQSSCAFFLTVMSFVNTGQLLASLLTRILISGFDIDWTETSSGFCKFRNYCLQTCALTSYTCMCLATIDQFLATSLRPQWQKVLTIKRAHYLCILSVLTWLLHGIPTLIWYDSSPLVTTSEMTCMITNSVFEEYITGGYLVVLTGILPILITVIFGSLAYYNVRQIPYRAIPLVRRELEKQLTSMILIQVVYNFFAIVPYISTLVVTYFRNSKLRISFGDYFIIYFTIANMIYYLYYASPFYIYLCVSKRFRQQFNHVILGKCFKCYKDPNVGAAQILPNDIRESQL